MRRCSEKGECWWMLWARCECRRSEIISYCNVICQTWIFFRLMSFEFMCKYPLLHAWNCACTNAGTGKSIHLRFENTGILWLTIISDACERAASSGADGGNVRRSSLLCSIPVFQGCHPHRSIVHNAPLPLIFVYDSKIAVRSMRVEIHVVNIVECIRWTG